MTSAPNHVVKEQIIVVPPKQNKKIFLMHMQCRIDLLMYQHKQHVHPPGEMVSTDVSVSLHTVQQRLPVCFRECLSWHINAQILHILFSE